MLFHFLRAVQAKSVGWLALETFIDEVSRLKRPAFRDVVFLDLDLFCKNGVSDLFSRLANIGTLSQHEFIPDDPDGKVINSHSVILSAHYLRSHISRSTRSFRSVVRIPNPSNPHVRDSDIPMIIKNQILRFDISMYDSLIMHVLKSNDHITNDEFWSQILAYWFPLP